LSSRDILDSASQLNFVSVSVSGIQESSLNSEKAVDIIVQSQDSCYHASFTAVATKTITDYQPQFAWKVFTYLTDCRLCRTQNLVGSLLGVWKTKERKYVP